MWVDGQEKINSLKALSQEERQKEINNIVREAKIHLQEAIDSWELLSQILHDYDGTEATVDKKVERGEPISKWELFSYTLSNLDSDYASKICGKLQKASTICRHHFSQDKFNS